MFEKEIAIIGTTEMIKPFLALGIECHETHDPVAAGRLLKEIVDAQKAGIVFIAEGLAEKLSAQISVLKTKSTPAVFILPEYGSQKQLGLRALEKTMARAVGKKI